MIYMTNHMTHTEIIYYLECESILADDESATGLRKYEDEERLKMLFAVMLLLFFILMRNVLQMQRWKGQKNFSAM